MTSKLYKLANYRKASIIASKVLLDFNIKEFPFNFSKVIKRIPDLKRVKYSSVAKRKDISISEVCNLYGSEEGALIFDGATYRIVYNDTQSIERQRFTLAHELGHYFLGHLKKDETIIQRNNLSEAHSKISEYEANRFARDILAPPYLVKHIPIREPDIVSSYFGVSFTMSQNLISFMIKSRENRKRMTMVGGILNHFDSLIRQLKYGQCCNSCGSHVITEKYCFICGSDDLHVFSKGENYKLKYNGIQVDSNSKAIECPICENTETFGEGNHCQICGHIIVNECSKGHTDNAFFTEKYLLNGHARFCDECGAQSTFFENGYLESYEKFQEEQELNKLLGIPIE